MKILITESKLDRLAINWLNDNYGNLESYKSKKYPDFIYYKKGKEVIFDYNKNNGYVFVNYDKIWSFFELYFSMDSQQIEDITTVWVGEHYNLDVRRTICNRGSWSI